MSPFSIRQFAASCSLLALPCMAATDAQPPVVASAHAVSMDWASPEASRAAPALGTDGTGALAAARQAGATLDIEAMKRAARELAPQAAPESHSPDEQRFSVVSPEAEKFRRKFSDGKRHDCLTAFQGLGTLALIAMPLAVLFDKKDSGCKF
jgi:hypothetical protein